MSLRVLRPGLATSVQDFGRPGWQQYGVPVSGAMDPLALRVANLLVGNNEGDAGLEMTLAGPMLLFEQEALIAVCGADQSPLLDDQPLPQGRPVVINAGATLRFGTAKRGCRAYLSIAGGIDVPLTLDSRSTYAPAKFGGLDGRTLQQDDRLECGEPSAWSKQIRFKVNGAVTWWEAVHPPITPGPILRAIRGSEFTWLSAEGQQELWSSPWKVSEQSDRMGYRLSGVPLTLVTKAQLVSGAVCPGTIQLPPSGDPVLLMADCAATGGYPKIAHIATVDLPLAAQLRPGDSFFLREIPLDEAHNLLVEQERGIELFKVGLRLRCE